MPLSAACKKKRGKLWQKERGLDDAYPLDKAIIVKKFRTHLHPGLQNALAIRKEPCYNAAVIESEIFRAGCDSLPVVQPTSRKA